MKRKLSSPFRSIREELRERKHLDPYAETAEDFSNQSAFPPSFRLAFLDQDFMLSDEARAVRLQLELLKPEIAFQKAEITSTVVAFGSSRILPPTQAKEILTNAQKDHERRPNQSTELTLKKAQRLVAQSRYYDEAQTFARTVSSACQKDGICDFVIVTGGGPGIMEAANQGAYDVRAKTVGLNILLPSEQKPNPYISEGLSFQFQYFAMRKMHFLLRAKALVGFPGGFGTLDELFEALTLLQTKKIKPIPVLLFGKAFWEKVIDFDFLVEENYISPEDLRLFEYVETASEAWDSIKRFYQRHE